MNKAINHFPEFWQKLSQLVYQQKLPHALLWEGGLLNHKKDFALCLAQLLLCQTQNACLSCQACQWVQAQAHPDLKLFPLEKDEAVIKIDEIRFAISHLQQTSHQGKYKIVIFCPAEAMGVNASNALLKTLEEPPPYTLIILISQYPTLLPVTIRSRCQRWLFPMLADSVNKDKRLVKLSETLHKILQQQTSPSQAASQWQGEPLSNILEFMNIFAVQIIQERFQKGEVVAHLFAWYDQIINSRRQNLSKINLNHLLTLENLFYSWKQCHAH